MKKAIVFALSVALLLCVLGVQTFAAGESVKVYVTISNGTLVLAQEPVSVTDIDGDGALTVNDALYCAHEASYKGGAAAGYGSAVGTYGLSLTKLWGVENGGSYGYYVNNASAMGLTDAVKAGDYINAFAYTDTAAFSDVYCYFDVHTVAAGQVTLTLSAAGFDANWAPIVKPVAGAEITVDGKATGFKTDADGKVTFAATAGVISAVSAGATLVPPVCIASAAITAPQTGDNTMALSIVLIAGLVSIALVAAARKKSAVGK